MISFMCLYLYGLAIELESDNLMNAKVSHVCRLDLQFTNIIGAILFKSNKLLKCF